MSNEQQQSSVQWFYDKLIEHGIIVVNQTTYQVKCKHEILLEQAKEMEKEYYTEFEVLQLLLKLQQTESYDNLYDWFEENKKNIRR